ncbi:MAG: tetratricopeptide repeat protein [Thermoanaerobaculia bacterium]
MRHLRLRLSLAVVAVLTAPVLRAAETTIPDLKPLELTAEMQTFADERVGHDQARMARLVGLQEAIFDPEDGLGVKYGSSATNTAAGTFEKRTGNCLSFTMLFVALARHLGLDAYFIEVDEVTGWSQRGEVGLSHWHMYVEVEVDSSIVPVDFLPWTERRYRSRKRISEERARAHFHNNVGVDELTLGNFETAIGHFERALELDATFLPAKVNLAVVLRRSGKTDAAERTLLEVLEAEPRNAVAAANLASLYLVEGRDDEAEQWLERREAFLNQNPFHHFRLGLRALRDGDPSEARVHFKRAITRQPDEAVFHEKLAETYFQLGKPRRARSNLKRALHYTEDEERRRALEVKLEGAG